MHRNEGKYAVTFGSFYANGRDVIDWEKDGEKHLSLVFPDHRDCLAVLRSILRRVEEDA